MLRLFTNRFFLPFLVVTFIPGIYYAVTGPLDPYHEGAIVPASVGVADGLTIYKEVNHQYGFVHILANALVFEFTGYHLLAYRIIGVVLIFFNAVLTFKISKYYVGRKFAAILCASTALISPAWSFFNSKELGTIGPWPNIYAITLVLSSILFWQKHTVSSMSFFLVTLSGICSSIASGVRIQYLIVIFLQSVAIAFMSYKKVIAKRTACAWAIGVAIGFSLILGFLATQNALEDAFEQIFVIWTMDAPNKPGIGVFHIISFLFGVLVFASIFLALYLFRSFQKVNELVSILFFALLLGTFLVLNSRKIEIFSNSELNTLVEFSLARLPFLSSSSLLILFLCTNLKDILASSHRHISHKLSHLDHNYLMITSSALGTFSLFHNINADYIFMSIQIFLIWFIARYCRDIDSRSKRSSLFTESLAISLVIPLLISSCLSLTKIDGLRYSYPTPFLYGIFEYDRVKLNSVESSFNFVREIASQKDTYLDCSAGIYSVNDSGYLLADKWNWNEIPREWRINKLESIQSGDKIVVCELDEFWTGVYENLLDSNFIEVIGSADRMTAYKVLKSPILNVD